MAKKKKRKEGGDKKGSEKQSRFLEREILNVLRSNQGKTYDYKQLSGILNIRDASSKRLINSVLIKLKNKGLLEEPSRGKFQSGSGSKETLIGKIEITSSGNAYVVIPDIEKDTFIVKGNTSNALNGDTVEIALLRSSRRPEGRVVKVIERKRTEFVGTIQKSKNFSFLIADNNRIHVDFFIPEGKDKGAKDGEKAIVRITDWPKTANNPYAEVIEVLGEAGENDTEIHAILAEYGLPYKFPNGLEEEAEKVSLEGTEKEIQKRRDFREITTFTIDPVDAKDFDDALSFQKLENGNYEVGVHIADVSHYVTPSSILDIEAQKRATSVYLVDRVVPMLPEALSNVACSLRPNETKLCFSAVFELDDKARVLSEWFGRTVIFSDRRFTYEEAQQIIETGEGDFAEEMLSLHRLASQLREERFKNGSIGFDKIEVRFDIDEKGKPIGVRFKEQKESNKLIEDFMLLANRKVAEFIGKYRTDQKERRTFVYRVHDSPNPEKLQNLSSFVKRFGYKINTSGGKETAATMNSMLTDVKDKAEANMIETLAIRSMAKAEYTTKNIGHYGLAFDYYTHFTSPIRRYPDVMVHRLLQHYLDGGKSVDDKEYNDLCKHSSEMEKLAADAERASIKFKQVEYLSDKIGQEFAGTISGVSEWGIYVEINENKCEGMVRIADISNDFYIFDEENYRIVGRDYGDTYQIGDQVKIVVKRANLLKKQLDFQLIEKL